MESIHSAATEVFRKNLLSRDLANQHFGWSEDSNTAAKYEHLFQDDAEKRLAEALGSGIAKRETPKKKIPRHMECPKCKYQNIPDAPFCTKCTTPLNVVGYIERENKIALLEKQVLSLQSTVQKSPQTQLALDEIKAAEEAKQQALRNEHLETKAAQQKKEYEMQMLKEQIEEIRYLYQDLILI